MVHNLLLLEDGRKILEGKRASEIFSGLMANDEIFKISKGEFKGIYYWAGKYFYVIMINKVKLIYK